MTMTTNQYVITSHLKVAGKYLEKAELIGSVWRANDQSFDISNVGVFTGHRQCFTENKYDFWLQKWDLISAIHLHRSVPCWI